MAQPALIVTDAPDDAAHAAIAGGLNAYNDAATGIADRRPLAVLVKDPATQAVVGGVLGRTSLGLLFMDLVFLPEDLRGGGIGSRMIALAEDEARRRGCVAAVLYTISFQAPDFYAKLGYREFGRVACLPPGTSRVFMTKPLA
jgi:GNAT superfamily N-acetyltransferase